ncbi:hypothetical protein [Rhodosalinus sp.]|uniref:hypothetical protein n=1 Tax=Rhodosalinus sp. TaxID=2047741 RepID=UPI003568644C
MTPTETLDQTRHAGPPVMRAICTVAGGLAGGVFIGGALGLWVLPGSNFGAEVLTLKAGLTAFLVMAGTTLISAARQA